ncbi:NAD-dependent epimerase/dehydratase family protein [Kitasatospora phosalacinea]|uniref:NAD-dependent epimerase/dehydratase family protein n=1 Tax=Kitasatospora phosalacinea TaxID=2065 RepID=A0ABW6GRD4_9ACTN
MRVLLTGADGFVGRHLHRAFLGQGDQVLGIDLNASPLAYGGDALDFFRTDRTRFDLAIHCAAIVGGRASIDGSPLGVATNLALDSWFMRWLAVNNIPRAVYYSSSAAYPVALQQDDGHARRLHEDDIDLDHPELPDATYGWAKLTGEQLARHVTGEGCRIVIPRPFSGYGGDQSTDYPFPSFIARAARCDDPFEIWGSGHSTRDWIHIDDIVGATLAAVDQDVVGPVNLGWGRATSFDELAHLAARIAGYRPQLKHLSDAPQGVPHRVCDPSRMLGFYQPTITLEEGIKRALIS